MKFGNLDGQGIAEVRNYNFQNLSTAPTTNLHEGRFYYNTVDHTLYVYNGTNWVNALTQGQTYLEGAGIDITSNTISIDLATGNNAGNVTLTATNGLAANVAEASTSAKGIIEIATDTEASTGTSEVLAVNPKQLATKVTGNTAITGATKCKITYDSKGLVTSGADLSASDIPNLSLSKITDVTATAAEVNVLDGITATTTELNYVDGVTSAIQTQLDGKVDENTAITGATKCKITYDSKGLVTGGADLSASDIPNLSLSKITDVTASASEVNVLDGITATTTELNYVDGVTSSIQTQLNNKLDVKPDGTNDLIDSSDKINMVYVPDVLLGQMLYAGTFVPSTAVATLTTNAQTILGTTSATITLTNDTTAITGYKANEGNFYIASAGGTFAGKTFQAGDWLLSTGDGWERIANTDAVTGVKGNAESTYRIGNVNITADNVLPTQTSNSGKFLTTNGTTASWGTVPDTLPTQTGNSGKFLTTNGTTPSWATVDALPSQSGNSGKFLTTNGTSASWTTAVTPDGTQTLTSKTIDADDNTISDLTTSNLKSGVLQTTVRAVSSASDTALASEKAIATGLAGKSTVTFVDWS